MPDYPQLTLFGGYSEPVAALPMPELPEHTVWRHYAPQISDRCDYCLMVERQQRPGRNAPVRRPNWARLGTDGAVLLLCDGHADQMLARGGHA